MAIYMDARPFEDIPNTRPRRLPSFGIFVPQRLNDLEQMKLAMSAEDQDEDDAGREVRLRFNRFHGKQEVLSRSWDLSSGVAYAVRLFHAPGNSVTSERSFSTQSMIQNGTDSSSAEQICSPSFTSTAESSTGVN